MATTNLGGADHPGAPRLRRRRVDPARPRPRPCRGRPKPLEPARGPGAPPRGPAGMVLRRIDPAADRPSLPDQIEAATCLTTVAGAARLRRTAGGRQRADAGMARRPSRPWDMTAYPLCCYAAGTAGGLVIPQRAPRRRRPARRSGGGADRARPRSLTKAWWPAEPSAQ